MSRGQPIKLLECRRQALKGRLLFWFFVVVAVWCVWGGWEIFQTYGLSQADGGVLKPLWERALFGAFIAAIGLSAMIGMWVYMGMYVVDLTRHGDRVKIVTLSPLGRQHFEYATSEVGKSAYYHGRVDYGVPSSSAKGLWVNAPWITLRVVGRRFPFVLDLQAEVINLAALRNLAEGGVQAYQEDGG